jgi:hypothetical protein
MKLSFRSLAVLSALVFFALALVWMFAPNVLLSSWGVAFSPAVGLMSRRAAALYAGIAVMLFSARNTEPSPARSALVTGFVVACLTLAALGVFELATGHAGRGIAGALPIEIALSLGFASVSRTGKTRF